MDGSAGGDCDGTTLGVDLNRNYDASFNVNQEFKAAGDPCFEFYAGKQPFSEPESQAIKGLLA